MTLTEKIELYAQKYPELWKEYTKNNDTVTAYLKRHQIINYVPEKIAQDLHIT